MIIVDTNVISEVMRPNPDEGVVRWMRFIPGDELFTTSITEAEMRFGAAKPPDGKRKRELEALVERTFSVRFAGHILPFDSAAARSFPQMILEMRRNGRSYSHSDAQIASIAHAHGAVLETRDIGGFDRCGIEVVNPWTVGVKS